MSLSRHFLDFSQPALLSAADYLIDRYQRGSLADMSNAIVVLPGRRAARRLLEILVEQAERQGLLLSPPTLETVGRLPEHLYGAKRPFASGVAQQLAWARVLRDADRARLLRVVAAPTAADDIVSWLDLAQLVWQLHTELAADGLDFRDVAERGRELETFAEAERWATLRQLQTAYLATLDALQLWDVQTARLVAIQQRECQIDRDVIVLGAVDMTITLRQMLCQVAERVTVLVHAPRRGPTDSMTTAACYRRLGARSALPWTPIRFAWPTAPPKPLTRRRTAWPATMAGIGPTRSRSGWPTRKSPRTCCDN